ncbi:maleylacetoacetate isomerase [Altererythrobacter sp.]|uniref:maleylacetoacetate isomerase n=1 Tax=Altererythrobacter sp. TaxID=1872480 RepID=UPI001B1E330E|nr:maleylacetoacetate isomerase [Altererythrobacter sp.]MBO6608572.1 maleylacetoacetate isomerase [Altererythrobacter sp.]MBO6642825.1 maleylacetoacetate isomerase [Altererythrobacter sp.]MBO6709568.1 maleylacetoacetate isomerase [Altererythrobacter sp.]
MKLYGYFRSSTTYRLRIALELKGIEYEYIPVNLLTSEQKGEAFTSRNPFGSVPMLEADERDRAQSMAQIEWLDEAYPDRPLLPADLENRYTARELAYAIATETHAVNNLPVLKYLKDPLGHSQEEIDIWYRHWLARTFTPLEARLAQLDAGDFLLDRPGLFEVVLLPQFYNAERFDFDFSNKPHIVRIAQACLALPEFQRAHPDNQIDNPERSS